MGERPDAVPHDVLEAYDLAGGRVEALESLINPTFLVRGRDRAPVIVQRLHPVFSAEVNLDIDAITARLAQQGLRTPCLLRSAAGALWVEREDGVWRAQSYVEGRTLHALERPEQAGAAGAAVAGFHAALDRFEHRFAFTRSGVHDTSAHLTALQRALSGAGVDREVRELGARILAHAATLPLARVAAQPTRLCHGDLKISNLRFAADGSDRVEALIDLDTVAYQSLAYELGDALRSWCNPHPEDGPAPQLDVATFEAAMAGYLAHAPGSLLEGEALACVPGVAVVAAELASRFCLDAHEDRYFGWDPARFPSRAAHDLARARSQLALSEIAAARGAELEQRLGALWSRMRNGA